VPNLKTAVFDIETDGLLDRLTQVHVLCIQEMESGKMYTYRGEDVEKGVRQLMDAETVVGHNIIFFDIPALQKVYPWFEVSGEIVDTLTLSQLIYSNQITRDAEFNGMDDDGFIPKKFMGKHGLESWGYRLGMHKGDYNKTKRAEARSLEIFDEDAIIDFVWGTWNQEMEDYCINDVELTLLLYMKILLENYPEEPQELDHDMAKLMWKQEQNGFPFDAEAAVKLGIEMEEMQASIMKECMSVSNGIYRAAKYETVTYTDKTEYEHEVITEKVPVAVTPKRSINYKKRERSSTVEGAPFTKIVWQPFNPGSRQQVAAVLIKEGWHPTEFSKKTGQPKVNDDTLTEAAKIIPVATKFADMYIVKKRLGQLATGEKAWLDLVSNEGKIHHHVTPSGAITGRAAHSRPNLGQVPSINWSEKDAEGNKHILMGKEGGWGYECRDLFHVEKPFVLMGADLKGIELRCLAHYMYKFDNGEYAKKLLESDIHIVNQKAAGLATRDEAKTFIYATLYGAGPQKIGSIVAPNQGEQTQRTRGQKLRSNFLKNTPALKQLLKKVETEVEKGYLVGLDKRHLNIRSSHAALNTLLQGAGATISKKWALLFEEFMIDDGFKHGWDGDFAMLAWVHDEIQVAVREEIADHAQGVALESALAAGEFYEFRLPTEADAKIGRTWAETH
jgi:DNA polymerase I-like protein with 3'-5' exonuclease and polymerase domains